MRRLRSEKEIMANWPDSASEPAVSICCVTYNHEKYIEAAIKSFLMQETDFPFEVIIGEDCSTDGTRNIIDRYCIKYPNLIRVISSDANVGMNRNTSRVFNAARGKYIAICEGDDHWTDSGKLQKQKDFMDSSEDYVLCYSAASIIDESGIEKGSKSAWSYRDSSESELLYAKTKVLTMTAFVRAEYLRDLPFEMQNVVNLDRFIFSYLGQFGKGKFITSIRPSVYNMHDGGVWSLLDKERKEASSMNTYYWMGNYFSRVGLRA